MWPTDYGYATGQQACQTALKKLNTDYLGKLWSVVTRLNLTNKW